MAILNRAGLKVKFKNGCLPTKEDFCDLIDSSLIKRDDQFFGKWQSGFTYYDGDVVIHEKTLYMYQADNPIEDCDEDPVEKPNAGFCSTTPPSEDNASWCKLQVDFQDGDWNFMVKTDDNGLTKSVMYDKDFDFIGIGTAEPEAQFQVTDKNGAGEFRFSGDAYNPSTYIINAKPDVTVTNYLLTGVNNEQVIFASDSDNGFLFRKGGTYTKRKDIEKEVNIKNEKLVHILPEGKVGIGRTPVDFELDVIGRSRNAGNFQIADADKIKEIEPIGSVLDDVCRVTPTKYQWKNFKDKKGTPLYFYGIPADACGDCFPDAIYTDSSPDQIKSISYEGLVPILFKAIQELKEEIDKLKNPHVVE